jgi:hypothetical protein
MRFLHNKKRSLCVMEKSNSNVCRIMKKYLILIISVITIAGLLFLTKYLIGKKLEISYVTSQEHTPEDLAAEGLLNEFDWFIIRSEEQRGNIEKKGYVVPSVDFSNNFLIISRYKMSKLYRKPGCDECLGVPDGRAIYDKKNSDENRYYFYLMPTILLSQGVP